MSPNTATKESTSNGLAPFEGKDTLSAGVEIRNAGGGLNEALAVDAEE